MYLYLSLSYFILPLFVFILLYPTFICFILPLFLFPQKSQECLVSHGHPYVENVKSAKNSSRMLSFLALKHQYSKGKTRSKFTCIPCGPGSPVAPFSPYKRTDYKCFSTLIYIYVHISNWNYSPCSLPFLGVLLHQWHQYLPTQNENLKKWLLFVYMCNTVVKPTYFFASVPNSSRDSSWS